jgi:hypothetical protein
LLLDDEAGVEGFLRSKPDHCEKCGADALFAAGTPCGFSCPDQAAGGLDDLKKASGDPEIA